MTPSRLKPAEPRESHGIFCFIHILRIYIQKRERETGGEFCYGITCAMCRHKHLTNTINLSGSITLRMAVKRLRKKSIAGCRRLRMLNDGNDRLRSSWRIFLNMLFNCKKRFYNHYIITVHITYTSVDAVAHVSLLFRCRRFVTIAIVLVSVIVAANVQIT